MAKRYTGTLQKMTTHFQSPVQYVLTFGSEELCINELLNRKVCIEYKGNILCIQCNRKTSRSFNQGYCYPCYQRFLECDMCSIHPERCRFYEGKCNSDDWAHAHCGQVHVVYLANSSGLKVGITRQARAHNRWMDQGAVQAMAIMEVQNRHQAGIVEQAMKQFVADKTNWRAMLRSEPAAVDLLVERNQLLQKVEEILQQMDKKFDSGQLKLIPNPEMVTINYPVISYPQKITTYDLDKQPEISGMLLGIKGQYLIFDSGLLNVRKFAGYEVDLNYE